MTGLAASAPPDGLTTTSSPSPSALRRTTSWEENGACSSAVSTGRSKTPACSAAIRVDGESVRSRRPRLWASMRWSMPVIQAGRSQSLRAVSPAARTTAAAPSPMGGQSPVRSGRTSYPPCATAPPLSWACGLASAAARLRAPIPASAASSVSPASMSAWAWRAARATESGQSGAR